MKDNTQQGFTIVEVIVTMIVTTIFLVAFVQAYLVVESQRLLVGQRAKASDLAYTNLRKFTARPSPAVLTCDAATMDISTPGSANKPGKVLGDETNTTSSSAYGFVADDTSGTNSLGKNVQQKVVAFAPQGCAKFATTPLKIVSTVTYADGRETVVHANFVN